MILPYTGVLISYALVLVNDTSLYGVLISYALVLVNDTSLYGVLCIFPPTVSTVSTVLIHTTPSFVFVLSCVHLFIRLLVYSFTHSFIQSINHASRDWR